MKPRTCKPLAALLALLLLAGPVLSTTLAAPTEAAPAEAAIELSSVEDLLAFSQNCSLDAWSRGKTFRLTADLDLTGRDFRPIPTFGGVFMGEGHAITGLRLSGDGSNLGLFRFVQPGAVIRDLRVSGQVTGGGDGVNVGGVAGNNAGSLLSCSFQGTVSGKANLGGVAGLNAASGELSGCSSAGEVTGESATGGVAGRNLGTLIKCDNAAEVNTASPDGRVLGLSNPLDQLAAPDSDEEEGEAILGNHTDTGGVAGYSSGVVQSCGNTGPVGYPHVGYNVGGVVGRQAGYMADCLNTAPVYGRKDVGGVVGQAEPDVILNTGEDTLERLRQELNSLDTLVDRALSRADASRADVSAQLTAIGRTTDDARDHAHTLLDHVSDFTDQNLDTLNTLTAAVTAALDGLTPALDDLAGASDSLDQLSDSLGDGLDRLSDSTDLADDVLADAKSALADLRDAGETLSSAAREARAAADSLQQSVLIHDHAAVGRAIGRLSTSLRSLGQALGRAHTALDTLRTVLHSQSGLLSTLRQIGAPLGELGDALGSAGSALEELGGAMETLSDNIEISWTDVRDALDSAGSALDLLDNASDLLDASMSHLQDAMTGADPLGDALGQAADSFSGAADAGSSAAQQLKTALQTLGDVAQRLSADADVTFTPLGQEVRDAGDGLFDSLSGLSDDLTGLQTAMDSAGDVLTSDLRAISRQITRILNLMLDLAGDARTVDTLDDLVGDLSEEDIDGTRLGKLTACRNTGDVAGDRNVGGVAGAVAVEYSLDPEDDADRFTFGSTYELKAILQACVNQGAVEARRDCCGGVAGRMDLGTATRCENYGPVSGSGSYVGGAVGYADAAVRDCWVKCTLDGNKYVGGVVGWGNRLTGCRALATLPAEGTCLGSVAGDADLSGDLRDNRFLDLGAAGIDGVSYAGIAEPVSYDDLLSGGGAPDPFLSFTLTLTADGQVVDRLAFHYGDDLTRLSLPQVPERDGYYGAWPAMPQETGSSDLTLDAVYTPWVTLVASDQADGKQSLALAEGRFTRDAALTVTQSQTEPPTSAADAPVWDVSLTGADLDPQAAVPMRLLNRQGGSAAVWQWTGSDWQRLPATANGSYLCFTMTGAAGTFCVCPASPGLLLPLLLALAAALLLAGGLLLLRRRKARKTSKTPAHA